jgi:hypothetical protein
MSRRRSSGQRCGGSSAASTRARTLLKAQLALLALAELRAGEVDQAAKLASRAGSPVDACGGLGRCGPAKYTRVVRHDQGGEMVRQRIPFVTLATLVLVAVTTASRNAPTAAPYLYWANGKTTIGRLRFDGTGVEQSFVSGTGRGPCGLALDREYIYWGSSWAGRSVVRIRVGRSAGRIETGAASTRSSFRRRAITAAVSRSPEARSTGRARPARSSPAGAAGGRLPALRRS